MPLHQVSYERHAGARLKRESAGNDQIHVMRRAIKTPPLRWEDMIFLSQLDAFYCVIASGCFFFFSQSYLIACLFAFISLIMVTSHLFCSPRQPALFVVFLALGAVMICGSAEVYLDRIIFSPEEPAGVTSYGDALYFSVITWTTVGYGDIRPSPDARLMTGIEALFGSIYMGIFISYVVSKLIAVKSASSPDDEVS